MGPNHGTKITLLWVPEYGIITAETFFKTKHPPPLYERNISRNIWSKFSKLEEPTTLLDLFDQELLSNVAPEPQ